MGIVKSKIKQNKVKDKRPRPLSVEQKNNDTENHYLKMKKNQDKNIFDERARLIRQLKFFYYGMVEQGIEEATVNFLDPPSFCHNSKIKGFKVRSNVYAFGHFDNLGDLRTLKFEVETAMPFLRFYPKAKHAYLRIRKLKARSL